MIHNSGDRSICYTQTLMPRRQNKSIEKNLLRNDVLIKNNHALRTSSLIIKLGRRPPSSGGISEPRRDGGPELGAREALRSASRITSILGASMVGALISGTLGPSFKQNTKKRHKKM